MNWPITILLANVVSTLFMVGLIWMVQIVHYPLFDDVGQENYVRYQQRHQRNITYVVAPVMFVELATSILLLFRVDCILKHRGYLCKIRTNIIVPITPRPVQASVLIQLEFTSQW